MEKFLFFFVHYGLIAAIMVFLLFRKPKTKAGVLTGGFFAVCTFIFLYLWGQWPLVGSYFARFLPVIAGVALVVLNVKALRSEIPVWPGAFLGKASVFILGGLALLLTYMIASAIAGFRYSGPAAELQFPLRNGDYYISSGGSSKIINNHMREYPNEQEFAIDINKLGNLGGASSNILSADNNRFHIFGESVHAPCSGKVKEAVRDVPDNAGAGMDVSAEDGSGNHVRIECGKMTVGMMHLRFGTVKVEAGDSVRAGQLIGEVGNSGFSQEPHLHLQAAVYDSAGNLSGVPMRFAGRGLFRNDVFSAPD